MSQLGGAILSHPLAKCSQVRIKMERQECDSQNRCMILLIGSNGLIQPALILSDDVVDCRFL